MTDLTTLTLTDLEPELGKDRMQAEAAGRELLRRLRELLSEVEGDNGLRASKDAGWAIAGARLKHIEELQESLMACQLSLGELAKRDMENEKRIADLEGEAECAVILRDRVLALESELSERPRWCASCGGDGYTESHEGAITHTCRTCGGCGMLKP